MNKHIRTLVALLLALVMVVPTMALAEGNPNADREKVDIRFAQFGNSLDDVDGFDNDPIRKAIEEKVNINLS